MTDNQTIAVILSAGKSTRMNSKTPKGLHTVAGRPMLGHVLSMVHALEGARAALVLAPEMDTVADYAREVRGDVAIAIQDDARGTGDAVKAALPLVQQDDQIVLIMLGDTPLMRPQTLEALRTAALSTSDIVVLGFEAADATGYGRLIIDQVGRLHDIIEHRDADDQQRQISLCFGGAMAVRAAHLASLLGQLSDDNAKGEFYLTEIVRLGDGAGLTCSVIECPEEEIMGVDSRADLAVAEEIIQGRLRAAAMAAGVTLRDPSSVHFSYDTKLGRDVVVEPHVVFGPGVEVEEGVTIKGFSHIEGARIAAGADIGPFARLRPGTTVGKGARVGNFVETKKAAIEEGAKVNHLTYIGDARVGAGANIGAGTITCNYDGFNKYFTDIGAGAFIGSNSSLVAPVTIKDGAYIGSGSVVTKDVGADALAVTRSKQIEREGWASRFRDTQSARKKKETT